MRIKMANRYKVMFIVFVSLGIYYPSLFGEVNSADDFAMITSLINTTDFSWKTLFFPMRPLYYYRPLLEATFLLDRFIFNCSASFMHLTNMLLHTTNGVLVFLIVKEMMRRSGGSENSLVPLLSSLLFVLHPVNTEAVNWISGRTDILAGMFVFLSFLVFLNKGLENYLWPWISAFIYLMGLLSKEAALGLIPLIGLFFVLKEGFIENISIRRRLALLIPFVVTTVIYFLMRTIASSYSDTAMAAAAKAAENGNLLTSISTAIKVFGFYIKKLFIPLPLNFGIIEINRTLYFWFGVITAAVALYLLLRKRTLSCFLFLSAILFFLPAIPVAISRIAWTPLGERYLYISSFGVSALIVILITRLPWKKEFIYGSLVLLLAVAALITSNRNIIWQNNLTLYEDTVRKSPTFVAARNEYGIALANRGRTAEALEQFRIAETLAGNVKYRERPALNIIALTSHNKKPEEIRENYLKLLEELPPESSEIILQKIIRNLDSQIREEKNPSKQQVLYRESISYMERLHELRNDGFSLYRIGQLYLALGEESKALEYFRRAVELSPKEFFSDPARKLIQRLNAKN